MATAALPLPPLPRDAPHALSTWLHFKGETAVVLATSRCTVTGEFLVTYLKQGQTWVRPYKEWHDEVHPGIRRFTFVA